MKSNAHYSVIHIGKCGGSSLRHILNKNDISCRSTHVPLEKPKYSPRKNYIILYRDPIKRFFSILNWRYYYTKNMEIPSVPSTAKHLHNALEFQFLDSLESGDQLCEWIKSEPERVNRMFPLLGHYEKGLRWYLSEIISKSRKNQFKAIIQTETFDEDVKRFFQIDSTKFPRLKSGYPKKFYIPTNNENILILKDMLKQEYKMFAKINKIKLKILDKRAI